MEGGIVVLDPTKLAKFYRKSPQFIFDLISLFPTDIIFFIVGLTRYRGVAIIRVNRLFRIGRMFEWFERIDTQTSYPNVVRITNLIFYVVIIIHWNGCVFFQISAWKGFDSDSWVYSMSRNDEADYSRLSQMYISSFYWSCLTLTCIGETPEPQDDFEIVFVTLDYLLGVLIFAVIIGNVGSMITNMNMNRAEFEEKLDSAKQYMEFRQVKGTLEKRVVKYFDYIWSNTGNLNEERILGSLPEKIRAEIAMKVHMDTLRRVAIFQDAEPGLLIELVLKLKLSVYSPGDFICRKGDIGKEMYILKRGKIQVVSPDLKVVYVTLSDGAVFGELSILDIAGNKNGNRRTANIRSVGYSDLFVLSKDALWDALSEYPEAKKNLTEKGKQILMKDNLLDEELARKQDFDQLTPNEKLQRAEETLEDLERQYATLLKEFNDQQAELKQRITKVEHETNIDEFEDEIYLFHQAPTDVEKKIQ